MKEKIKKMVGGTVVYTPLKFMYHFFSKYAFGSFGYFNQYIVFPIKACFRAKKIRPFYNGYEEIETYKNKYNGKRCFIIATGPSLKLEDVEKLDGEYTFAVNSFYKTLDKTSFKPTFYLTFDISAQEEYEKNGRYNPAMYAKEKAFLNDMLKKKYNHEHVIYLPVCFQNHWYGMLKKKFDYSKNLKWTEDLLWGVYDKYTVTICAIDIAAYMGFKEIYLVGVDCDYSGVKTHFIDSGDNNKIEMNRALKMQESMIKGYEFIADNMNRYGITVYNATRGGKLETFCRVNLDSLF